MKVQYESWLLALVTNSREVTFGTVTLIFEPLGRYLCWWRIRSSRRYHQLSIQFSIAEAGTSLLMSVIKY